MLNTCMLTDIKTIKQLCAKYHLRPDKQYGQNFLIDKQVVRDIIDAAHICSTDTVIEIGAGVGTLTSALAQKAEHVYAFEIDARLYPVLEKTASHKNVEIIKENIVHTRAGLEQIIARTNGNYKIVANIPYSITGQLVRIFLELQSPPERVVVMVQKEVAERITARPGKMSVLSVAAHYYAHPHIVRVVPASAFYPAPRVASAVIAWTPHRTYEKGTDEAFFSVARAGFMHPRKLLKNNLIKIFEKKETPAAPLSVALCMKRAGLKETARPGDLTVEEWMRLSTCLKAV